MTSCHTSKFGRSKRMCLSFRGVLAYLAHEGKIFAFARSFHFVHHQTPCMPNCQIQQITPSPLVSSTIHPSSQSDLVHLSNKSIDLVLCNLILVSIYSFIVGSESEE